MSSLPTNSNDLTKEMIDWRHGIHQYPELGFEEYQTSSKVTDPLRSFRIDVYEGTGRKGIVGILKCGASSKVIGLNADMDSLGIYEKNIFSNIPKTDVKMHVFGHDVHTAMLLGSAKLLARQPIFDSTVVFFFNTLESTGVVHWR